MASTQSRTTPVRAIISTISSRSSPSIPPPTHVYEPAVKSVLRFRLLYSIFPYSAALSWLHAVVWTIWGQGGFSALGMAGVLLVPFRPLTLFAAFITWISAALPAAVLRKVFLTSTRTPATSPSSSLKAALSKTSTTRAFVTYMVSATAAVALHALLAYSNEPKTYGDPKLGVFVRSRRHPYYLNGRLVFLVISQLSAGLGFTLRNIMMDRFVFRWPASSDSPNRVRPLRAIDTLLALIVAALFTSLTLPFSATVFGLARLALPVLYKLPIFPTFLRPFTAHFLRGSWTIFLPFHHMSLLIRGWFLGVSTVFMWESSDVLFDAFITQPISISHMAPDPNIALVSGVSSTDTTFRYFAYSELKELSSDASKAAGTRRVALFSDQKYNPNLWSRLVRESLILLGNDYQLLLRRGKPLPTPPPAPAPKSLPPPDPAIAKPAPLLRKSIYQSTQHSPIRTMVESLGSDGPLAQALDAGADAANIPELFRSVESAVLPTPVKGEVRRSVENATGIIARTTNELKAVPSRFCQRFVPTWAAGMGAGVSVWWTEERISKTVQACLPNKEIDVAIIDVLSHLTCASLTEDKYGVVQRDIPKILEAMLSFLSAIEEYQVEINTLYVPPTPNHNITTKELQEKEDRRLEVEKAGDTLVFVADGLKEGVARIVRTFGDRLAAFKFPPRTAQKLQGFLEYC